MGRTVGYVRASTAKQVGSPHTQKTLIRDYCRRQGLDIRDSFYVDDAKSGKTHISDRAAGGAMMNELRAGDHVVVARLDRLSRSFVNFAQTLDQLERLGVTLHICDLPGGVLDPGNPISTLLIQILVSFAQYERRLISIRIQEGLSVLASEGCKPGNHPPFGRRWVKRYSEKLGRRIRVTEPNPDEELIMSTLISLRTSGMNGKPMSWERLRQYFAYEWPVKTRTGLVFSKRHLQSLYPYALKWASEKEATRSAQQAMKPDPEQEAI